MLYCALALLASQKAALVLRLETSEHVVVTSRRPVCKGFVFV